MISFMLWIYLVYGFEDTPLGDGCFFGRLLVSLDHKSSVPNNYHQQFFYFLNFVSHSKPQEKKKKLPNSTISIVVF